CIYYFFKVRAEAAETSGKRYTLYPGIKGSPVGRPLCFTMDIADFSNFDRFVLGPQVNNRTGIATEDVPRQGPSSPQVSAKSAERLLS
ncbi:hypothetical protein, partial [Pseudoalteromonas sp.]|uniref:hypothetical protein n=1 Tax=Pseudoalteromonas sp. TaxID=53249 RepID=UPI002626C936